MKRKCLRGPWSRRQGKPRSLPRRGGRGVAPGFARVRSATAIYCPRASFRKLARKIIVGSCQSPEPPGRNRAVPALSNFHQPRRRIEKGYRHEANGHEHVSRNACLRTREKSNCHRKCDVDSERERAGEQSKGEVENATFSFSEREYHWGLQTSAHPRRCPLGADRTICIRGSVWQRAWDLWLRV